MNNCIFCSIIEGKLKSKKIDENEAIIAIEDINPQAKIHYLIIPKVHIENISDIDHLKYPDIGSQMFKMAQKLSNNIKNNQGFKFLINNGYESGQRVFHLHAHFLSDPFNK
jgi:histidine triad (HIT) family protein